MVCFDDQSVLLDDGAASNLAPERHCSKFEST